MNTLERCMLDMAKRGRDEYGLVGLKAEFEAEGTRPDELMRLLEIVQRAGLKFALKIGGCEALSDLYASRLYGANYVIAPMVETPYALTKFIDIRNKVYDRGNGRTRFLYNLETKTALANLAEMAPIAQAGIDGIVFGRVDFTLSCGLARSAINDRRVTDSVLQVARVCAEKNLELVVGGAVTLDAAEALREMRQIRLDRFETRKMVFDGAFVEQRGKFADGIQNALEFELSWLLNKRDYYAEIAGEDADRIRMMQARLAALQGQSAA